MAFNLEKWIRCMAMDALNSECPTKKKSIPISVQTGEFGQVKHSGPNLFVGMATSQVRAGFFHTETQPVAKTCGPDLARLLSGFFSQGPDPPLSGPTGPIRGPTKKKKKELKPKFIFAYIQAYILIQA